MKRESQSPFDLHFLITKDVEHSLLVKNLLNSLCILDIAPMSDIGIWNVFSQPIGCHFFLLTVLFALEKLFSFIRFPY